MIAGYDWIHVACVVTSILMVAKNSAEHHYHEVSGKTKIPSTKEVLVSFLYYLLTVPARKVKMHRFVKRSSICRVLLFIMFCLNVAKNPTLSRNKSIGLSSECYTFDP